MDMQQEHILASRLRACGHFLYYQTGGKSGQQRILMTLLFWEDLTQKEMQEILEISSGALSEILQKMEDASLVKRKKSRDDKRQVKLALTPAGKRTALEEKARYLRALGQMFECLSGQEKTELEEILEKLVKHLYSLKDDPMFESDNEEIARPSRVEGE